MGLVSLLISIGVAYVLVRWRLLRADSWGKWLWATIPTLIIALLLLIIAGFSSAEADLARLPTITPIVDSAESIRRAELLNEYVMVEGVVSAENTTDFYAATIVKIEPRTFLSADNQTITAPDLKIELPDGFVMVPPFNYQPLNWIKKGRSSPYLHWLHHLRPNDTVVLFGSPSLGRSSPEAELGSLLIIDATFIYRGSADSLDIHEQLPNLQRDQLYAQIVMTISLISAIIVSLTPLYQAMHIWQSRQVAFNIRDKTLK